MRSHVFQSWETLRHMRVSRSHYQGSHQNLGPGLLAEGQAWLRKSATGRFPRTAVLTQGREYHLGWDVLLEIDFGKERFRKDIAVSLEGI